MKRTELLFVLILFSFAGFAQDLGYAKQIVNTLSSPAFKGRGYVEKGDKISADYIAGEFQSLGLSPITEKSYFQKFDISVNTLPSLVFLKINDTELKPAVDYLIEPASPSVNGIFPVVSISREQLGSKEELESAVSKASGAFLLIDSRKEKEESPEIKKQTDENVKFLTETAEGNMKGIIILTNEKLTWRAAIKQGIRPVVTLKKDMDPKTIKTVDIRVNAKFIKKYETQNVIGYIRGNVEPDSMIVMTAHYDHLGMMGRKVYFPGANDNASGVAMVLNMAKHYAQARPKYTMVFVTLTGEEYGLLGSKAFVANPPVDLKKIKFLVNFDMAGTGDDGITVVNGSIFKKQFDTIKSINDKYHLVPAVKVRGEACNSDHCPFYQQGVPSFFIYTMGGISAYHDIYDRFETLPFTVFADYCNLMIRFFDTL